MPATLYYSDESAPCRAVEFTAAQIGFPLEIKDVDLAAGDQLKPEFIKINPQHNVPTLVDGGLVLLESRAIIGYLVNRYAKDDSLYPKDPVKRVLIDQRLYFDAMVLYQRFGDAHYPALFYGGPKVVPEDKLKSLHEALGYLEMFLTKTKFVAADHETIADHSILSSVLTFQSTGVSLDAYPKILSWLNQFKNHKGYKRNLDGANVFGAFAKQVLGK